MLVYDEWRTRLRECCGHYYSEPTKDCAASERFDVNEVHGLHMASINCTINRLSRTQQGIRRDDAEHFFLLHQVCGETGVRHCNKETVLRPGEFLLLDSTRPAELFFENQTSEFESVHIPRNLFLSDRKHAPATGTKVTSRHPLHASLENLTSIEVNKDELDHFKSEDFFDFVAMAFGPELEHVSMNHLRNRGGRMRYMSQVIDQNLSNPDFSIDYLARCVGRSRRQLQRDFSSSGTSFTEFLLERRLQHFIAASQISGRRGRQMSIAELAHSSGFSDQSHFNRIFKKRYDLSPTAYLSRAS
ncbi:hypothetical protein A8B82_17215 [Sulfitobacter sp. EhC04]|uniref:helix-turn-helix domain-containing protein n=1 Tax=Sulfitobacter sp. EhC04 TaxID=1849168 RepID=UPI0007F507A7|nr:helix-turn-helix domain-containing protein [Sulfitobacter sp. EhC04]OAN75132.1 hypothetical protein A8B82_17215 [Sulfitobacter sp. EhC04]